MGNDIASHYYAYGLKIATLSSKKLGDSYEGSLKNNYLYQGAYSELDDDIGWHDFALRNYDAQIGRWVQQDPYQQFASPYLGMGDDPVNNIDPSGGVVPPIGGLSTTAATAITMGEVVVYSASRSIQAVNTISRIAQISIILHSVNLAVSIVNISVNTSQVGDRGSIYQRGLNNAYFNAISGGFHDLFFGTNLEDYDDLYDQESYLRGRLAGDALALAQSVVTFDVAAGGGAAASIESGGTSIIVADVAMAASLAIASAATADIAWTYKILYQVQKTIRDQTTVSCGADGAKNKDGSTWKDPEPNQGESGQHGGTNHNEAIDKRITELQGNSNIKDIRKNQVQVDVNGKRVGNNRPDVQYKEYDPQTKSWKQHVIEYDNNISNSVNHGKTIKANDPNAVVELNVLKQ